MGQGATRKSDTNTRATIRTVWNQYKGFAATARTGQTRSTRAQRWALLLAVVGVAAMQASSFPWLTGQHASARQVLAGGGALVLAIAGYVGRELLKAEGSRAWYRARLLAEALKREAWRALMRVPPYHDADAATLLAEKAASLQAASDGLTAPDDGPHEVPKVQSVGDYIIQRVEEQIEYYARTAAQHEAARQRLTTMTTALGIASVVVGGLAVRFDWLALATPVLATATGAIATYVQARRLENLPRLYQVTAANLALLRASWLDGDHGPPESDARSRAERGFVEACEAVMSRENESWQAEWSDEKSAEVVQDFIARTGKPSRGHQDLGELEPT